MSSEPPSTKDPFHLAGTTIEGKYRVASVVGDGGFGVVYRGVHKGFGELIAIKCLKLPQELDDAGREAFLEQLREEGRLLHRLSKSTPGIVQALDVGAFTTPEGAWVPFLVLEWLEGETLADLLKKLRDRGEGALPLADAIRLLDPAARALAIAHQQKIAHRDVKPANLFVADVAGKRTLKVLDFGIAKVLTEHPSFTEQLAATKMGPTAFTPRYGAPEQFNKQRGASGPWTDVFALALIFVELVTGRKALDGDDPTQLYIASADPQFRPTPRALGTDVPDRVEAVLERALRIEPKFRYPDAGEFWNALLDAAGEAAALGPITPPPTGARESAAEPKPSSDPTRKDAALQATLPAESLLESASGSSGARAKVATPSVPKTATSARDAKTTTDDPMAETPLVVRAPEAVTRSSAPAAEKPSTSSRAIAIVAMAVVAGGGVAAYFGGTALFAPAGASSAHASARPSASAKPPPAPPRPSASSTSSASTATSSAPIASASAGADGGPARLDGMIFFAKGSFDLGDPPRAITLTKGFYLDKREVSARDYLACVAARKCGAADRVTAQPDAEDGGAGDFVEVWSKRCTAASGALDHPMNCVDFASAEAYCRFVGKRLPTEAEWELAAAGKEGRRYPWGDAAPDCARTCFDRNGGACQATGQGVTTCALGSHAGDATPDGVEDLGGDVAEWIADGFAPSAAKGTDPKGDASAPARVVRGGSFLDGEERLRTTYRSSAAPVTASVAIGFRCALDAAP